MLGNRPLSTDALSANTPNAVAGAQGGDAAPNASLGLNFAVVAGGTIVNIFSGIGGGAANPIN